MYHDPLLALFAIRAHERSHIGRRGHVPTMRTSALDLMTALVAGLHLR